MEEELLTLDAEVPMSRLMMVCGGLLMALSLRADVIIYDSTGQASSGSDPVQSFGPLYDSFSTGSNSGNLSTLIVVLAGASTSGGSITVNLYADSGSATVGSLIGQVGTINDSSLLSSESLISVSLSANPFLAAGTRYWIGLSGATTGEWFWTLDTSGTGVNGEFFQNGGGTFANNSDGGYRMQVALEETSSPVPEPTSVILLTTVLLGLGLAGRRQSPKAI